MIAQSNLTEECSRQASTQLQLCREAPHRSVLGALITVWRNERMFRFQSFCCLTFTVIAAFLQFDVLRWAITTLAIIMVLSTELINSAVERLADERVGSQFSKNVRELKDISAGAVLCVGIAAITVGILLVLSTPAGGVLTHR